MTAALYAIQVLSALLQVVPMAQATWLTVQKQRNALEQMQAEKRDPTPEEWAELNALVDGLRAQLREPPTPLAGG